MPMHVSIPDVVIQVLEAVACTKSAAEREVRAAVLDPCEWLCAHRAFKDEDGCRLRLKHVHQFVRLAIDRHDLDVSALFSPHELTQGLAEQDIDLVMAQVLLVGGAPMFGKLSDWHRIMRSLQLLGGAPVTPIPHVCEAVLRDIAATCTPPLTSDERNTVQVCVVCCDVKRMHALLSCPSTAALVQSHVDDSVWSNFLCNNAFSLSMQLVCATPITALVAFANDAGNSGVIARLANGKVKQALAARLQPREELTPCLKQLLFGASPVGDDAMAVDGDVLVGGLRALMGAKRTFAPSDRDSAPEPAKRTCG